MAGEPAQFGTHGACPGKPSRLHHVENWSVCPGFARESQTTVGARSSQRNQTRGEHDLMIAVTALAASRTVLTTDRSAKFQALYSDEQSSRNDFGQTYSGWPKSPVAARPYGRASST
jgi:hypothetical protein